MYGDEDDDNPLDRTVLVGAPDGELDPGAGDERKVGDMDVDAKLERREEEEEEEEMPATDDTPLDAAMEGGALPANTDTEFTGVAGDMPVESVKRDTLPGQGIAAAVKSVSGARILERMFNEGNMVDLAAEIVRQ